MPAIIEGRTYDEERALYHLTDATVRNCTFAGPADGESAFKEARNVTVSDTSFSLRYPLWHVDGFSLVRVDMDEKTRAALWYSRRGTIKDSRLDGVKCLRECDGVALADTVARSPEFGWKCRDLTLTGCDVTSEYFLFLSQNVTADRLTLHGKYSFQYVCDALVTDSVLDTKDAFWHTRNVTVRDTVIRGEYLGWYSDGLTLERCRIIGTQPLCYCKNLRLIDCEMEAADLSFEYSDVEATVRGRIDSVKNPHSGRIRADEIGEIILGDAVMDNTCVIETARDAR